MAARAADKHRFAPQSRHGIFLISGIIRHFLFRIAPDSVPGLQSPIPRGGN